MPLIKNGDFVEDTFVTVADDAPMPANGSIVTLTRFKKDIETLLVRNAPLGVRLQSSESPEELGEDAHRLSVVALEFPRFRDGRGFSWARLLRTRMNYTGEIRAVGAYLYDQIAFMRRVGIDAFEVPEGFTLEQYRRALDEMSFVYQPSTDGHKTIREMRAGREASA